MPPPPITAERGATDTISLANPAKNRAKGRVSTLADMKVSDIEALRREDDEEECSLGGGGDSSSSNSSSSSSGDGQDSTIHPTDARFVDHHQM